MKYQIIIYPPHVDIGAIKRQQASFEYGGLVMLLYTWQKNGDKGKCQLIARRTDPAASYCSMKWWGHGSGPCYIADGNWCIVGTTGDYIASCGARILGYRMGNTIGGSVSSVWGEKQTSHIHHSYKYIYIQHNLRVQSVARLFRQCVVDNKVHLFTTMASPLNWNMAQDYKGDQ